MENSELPDGVGIYFMLPTSALNQYANMEYNNVHHNLQSNVEISTSNNSSVSTLTSPSVISTNDEGCSLFSTIHDKIKYLYLSKTQSIDVSSASAIIKSQIKLLAKKHDIL